MGQQTTIKLHLQTKEALDKFREHKSETYDEVIQKMIFIANHTRKEPQLSRETVEAIERARERYRKGQFISLKDARKRLGL